MSCDWRGAKPSKVATAAAEHARAKRETRETPALREYTALFAVLSVLSQRFAQCMRTRSGRVCADRAQALIDRAIHKRHHGDVDRAVQCLHRAAEYLRKGDVVEETFSPRLDQLWHGYHIVARGVEPGSEAHECLERFVVAVDLFNDATVRDDTDFMVETFDRAVDLLKSAALARPRRCQPQDSRAQLN